MTQQGRPREGRAALAVLDRITIGTGLSRILDRHEGAAGSEKGDFQLVAAGAQRAGCRHRADQCTPGGLEGLLPPGIEAPVAFLAVFDVVDSRQVVPDPNQMTAAERLEAVEYRAVGRPRRIGQSRRRIRAELGFGNLQAAEQEPFADAVTDPTGAALGLDLAVPEQADGGSARLQQWRLDLEHDGRGTGDRTETEAPDHPIDGCRLRHRQPWQDLEPHAPPEASPSSSGRMLMRRWRHAPMLRGRCIRASR